MNHVDVLDEANVISLRAKTSHEVTLQRLRLSRPKKTP